MPTIDASELPGRRAYRLLVDCVVPRPIAWVSTVDGAGTANLAPFSFFQAVGAEPPSVIVSIGRHRDGAFKDTGVNLRATGECVVNVVTDELAEAMNLTAGEYPFGVDEMARAAAEIEERGVGGTRTPVEQAEHDAVAGRRVVGIGPVHPAVGVAVRGEARLVVLDELEVGGAAGGHGAPQAAR